MTKEVLIKIRFVFLIITISITNFCFSQSRDNSPVYSQLKEIDYKIDNWEHNEAIHLLDKLENIKGSLRLEEQFAIELRRFKAEYYINNNDDNFALVLKRIDQIERMNTPQLEYDYLSFIGEIYKISFHFDNAIKYHKKALYNAEKRKDTIDMVFTYWTLGSCFYTVEYVNKPDFFKNKLDSALHFYNKALRFPENKQTNKFLPRIYDNLGRIETAKGNISKAKQYINKALQLNKKTKNSFGISISLNNLSKVALLEKEYQKSIKFAEKSNDYIENRSQRIKRNNFENIAVSNYYLGHFKIAFDYMKKALNASKNLTIKTFGNDVKKIETKYKIAKEQQKTLEEKNKRLQTELLFLYATILILILSFLGIIFYLRNRKYKKYFKKLMEDTNKNDVSINAKATINLSQDIINNILKKLNQFEESNAFLVKNLTINELSKNFKTNAKYLSNIINTYKNKSFTAYLNELRIDYVIQRLKKDQKFQKYTIQAIADEIGFSYPPTFSNAFRKKTGINPSYFIRQLEKEAKTTH
jgi:AraC-like DNA-binding protein